MNLPITFCLYTSTKGHWGRRTDWRVTLDHWDRQVPLALFGERICHLKVTPSEEPVADEMTAELRARGFHVIRTTGTWSRGMSMQAAYMADCVTVSKESRVFSQPYYLHVEDDSPVVVCNGTLETLLLQSCAMLAKNHEMVSVRVARRGDARGPTFVHPSPDPRYYWSADLNFQPLILRSLDFYRLALALEWNPQYCESVQCEMLWRLITDQFSRSQYKHAVWETSHAYTPHLGVPQGDYEATLRQLSP